MVHFFIGTKAQFIKMAPIMVEMRERGLLFRYIDSGQHADLTRSLRKVFGVRDPDVCLRTDTGSIVTVRAALRWYLGCRWKSLFHRNWLEKEIFPGGGICLIHGDTLSTLLGMHMAIRAGLKVAHVEAGLRSFHIWDPFPEEIIRIRCMRQSYLLFAPSEEASANLQKMGLAKRVVKVSGNTVVDALRLINTGAETVKTPERPFALATCHRLETITRKDRLERVVKLLNRVALDMAVIFVIHQPTRKYLDRFSLTDTLHSNVKMLDMMDYTAFIALVKSASIVLADGGSIQEECSYLNKPCLILRNATERLDGIGKNAVLWKFDDNLVESFLLQTSVLPHTDLNDLPHPSAEIVDALIRTKFIHENQQHSMGMK